MTNGSIARIPPATPKEISPWRILEEEEDAQTPARALG
jgi:hypothetical protein